MHLTGLPQTLEVDLVLDVVFGLPFTEGLTEVVWINGASVRLTNQKPVIMVISAQNLFVLPDLFQPQLNFFEKRSSRSTICVIQRH